MERPTNCPNCEAFVVGADDTCPQCGYNLTSQWGDD